MRTARSSSRPGEGGLHTHPRDQAPPLWTEFLTHACENITLPQTSFAIGNYNSLKNGAMMHKGWTLWNFQSLLSWISG